MMNRILTSNTFGLISVLMLSWPMTASADTASDFINVSDDEADDSTYIGLLNTGFGGGGLCLQDGNLEFYVDNSCAGSDQEMLLTPNGDFGIGTGAPQGRLHLLDNSPVMRIEDSIDGTAFDLMINAFFPGFGIRETGTSGIPQFKIEPGADSESLVIDSSSALGVGTSAPTAPIHVERGDDTFEMLYLEQSNTSANQDRNMMQLDNNGGIRFQFDNTELNTQWRFQAATGGADVFEIAKVGTGDIELRVDASGNLDVLGAVNSSSSRTVKTDIEPVAGDETLTKVAELPIAEWRYTDDTDGARHLGPMAEDFYAAFGLGADNKHIAPQDMAGVALAAVKALRQRSEQQSQTIEKQQGRIAELERQNRRLQAGLDELEALKAQVAALQAAQSSRQVASRQ